MRRARASIAILFLLATLLARPTETHAFEAFDGRVQVHGYYEQTLRAINADFSEQWDVTQWYHIVDVEIEVDILQDTWGPFDLMSAFIRLEGRFDCIYSRGCGMFHGVNAYGDRAKSLPRRLSDGVVKQGSGVIFTPELGIGRATGSTRDPAPLLQVGPFRSLGDTGRNSLATVRTRSAMNGGPVLDTVDPARFTLHRFLDYRFTAINQRGGSNYGATPFLLGPWRPKDEVRPNATLADIPNPFDPLNSLDMPTLTAGDSAFGALPNRPIPYLDEGGFGRNDDPRARGLFVPSRALQRWIHEDRHDAMDINYSELERAFNHGASQEDEGELKEAYLDIEMFDSQLWLRVGKQTIVWGKTELFSATDQFNPQDLALSSLPSLEESRIPLWAVRAVWSFYEVGPLADVRAELAVIVDDMQPADLGACGEPYTVNLVCGLSVGTFAHGLTGVGIVGTDRPDDPWDDIKGIDFGGRIEWRWDRFSFAISDFYGYQDLPTIELLGAYERNVDPLTGRPRFYGSRARCRTQYPFTTSTATQSAAYRSAVLAAGMDISDGCLRPGSTDRSPYVLGGMDELAVNDAFLSDPKDPRDPRVILPGGDPDGERLYHPNNALERHPANLQALALACSVSIGTTASDISACGINIFASTNPIIPRNALTPPLAPTISALFGGTKSPPINRGLADIQLHITEPTGVDLSAPVFDPAAPIPVVGLNRDIRDVPGDDTVRLTSRAELFDPVNGIDYVGELAFDAGSGEYLGGFDGVACKRDGLNAPGRILTVVNCGGVGSNITSLASVTGPTLADLDYASLGAVLTPEQEGLLGCGPFWGTNCDDSGIDILNTDASVFFQSWPGFEGSAQNFFFPFDGAGNPLPGAPAPGTIHFVGGPVGSVAGSRATGLAFLPGARSPVDPWRGGAPNPGYQPRFDGCVTADPGRLTLDPGNPPAVDLSDCALSNYDNGVATGIGARPGQGTLGARDIEHPFAREETVGGLVRPQLFSSELAAISWNIYAFLVLSDMANKGLRDPLAVGQCSLVTGQFCRAIQGLMGAAGVQRNVRRAGGNGTFGRRTFIFHSGGEVALTYDKRNVLGFAVDFAEDVTKTNFSIEATWLEGARLADADRLSGLSRADEYNLTISVDRPTFINFLNPNRTFLFNAQFFFQYRDGWQDSFAVAGPWNLLMTLVATTGYFQDRLVPSLVFVYDVQSQSGGILPSLRYSFSERFSATFGATLFMGRSEYVDMPVRGFGPAANRSGDRAYFDTTENGLSVLRDRDELYLTLRYTF